jgi:hypothetical protein
VSCVWLCPTYIVLYYLSSLSSSRVLCMVVSNYTRHRRRQRRQITQHYVCWTQPCTRHRRRQRRQITQRYMCWKQPYTRHNIVLCYLSCLSSCCVLCMVVSNTYSVVLSVLFVVVLCLVYGFVQHIHYMCWTQQYTRHRRRQTRQITQHYMCWTQPYTRHRR